MWCVLRKRIVIAYLCFTALACALAIASETSRDAHVSAWAQMSGGLGLGSQAGVEAGFFAYDSRLESLPDGMLLPLPGFSVDPGAGGVFTLQPASRPEARER